MSDLALSLQTRLMRGPYQIGFASRNQKTGKFCPSQMLNAMISPEWLAMPLALFGATFGLMYAAYIGAGKADGAMRRSLATAGAAALAYTALTFALGYRRSDCGRQGGILDTKGRCLRCPSGTTLIGDGCVCKNLDQKFDHATMSCIDAQAPQAPGTSDAPTLSTDANGVKRSSYIDDDGSAVIDVSAYGLTAKITTPADGSAPSQTWFDTAGNAISQGLWSTAIQAGATLFRADPTNLDAANAAAQTVLDAYAASAAIAAALPKQARRAKRATTYAPYVSSLPSTLPFTSTLPASMPLIPLDPANPAAAPMAPLSPASAPMAPLSPPASMPWSTMPTSSTPSVIPPSGMSPAQPTSSCNGAPYTSQCTLNCAGLPQMAPSGTVPSMLVCPPGYSYNSATASCVFTGTSTPGLTSGPCPVGASPVGLSCQQSSISS